MCVGHKGAWTGCVASETQCRYVTAAGPIVCLQGLMAEHRSVSDQEQVPAVNLTASVWLFVTFAFSWVVFFLI